VTLVLFGRIALSHRRLNRIVSAASGADSSWQWLADDVRASLGITRQVRVRVTDATNVPAIAGLWQPVLLLPMETDTWPIDQRRAVLLHELAHVARWDGLAQLLDQIACAIYWFVPLVWYGARRAAVLRELASDDVVLRAGMRPSTYVQTLISLVQSRTEGSAAALAMAQPSRMQERVMAILNPTTKREQVTWRSMFAACALTVAATVGVAAVQPVPRQTIPGMDSLNPVPESSGVATTAGPKAPIVARKAAASVTAAARQAPSPAQSADRFCAGKKLNHDSQSTNDDGKTRRWTVRISGEGCSLDLVTEGQIGFTGDFTDISSISDNGYFRLDVTDKGVRRQLEVESRGGALTRTWRLDGRERPYDADAKSWFAGFLIDLDRRTAIGVDVRLPLLLKQGGVDAVLTETALMDSDYARSRYFASLAHATKLSSADVTRILKQAIALKASDYYAGELVKTFGSGVKDAAVRAALIDVVNHMTSDYYQATSIETIVGPGAPGAAELDVLVQLVPRMTSDHYKTQVLTKVQQADGLTANHQIVIANVAAGIDSDYYAAEVLKPLARKGLRDDAVKRAFFAALAKIQNDYYRSEALSALLSASSLSERDLMDAVSSTKGMSDHYKMQSLQGIARHAGATERVRAAVVDATAGMSQYYADQVRRAAGK